MADQEQLYGLVAEFTTPEALLEAARTVRAEGYARIEAYSPFPVEGLTAALGFRDRALPLIALIGGIMGGGGGYLLQWFLNRVNYPINIGGRPLNAWPAFAVPASELPPFSAPFSQRSSASLRAPACRGCTIRSSMQPASGG